MIPLSRVRLKPKNGGFMGAGGTSRGGKALTYSISGMDGLEL